MDNAIWGMLNDTEQELLRDTTPAALSELDEDALVDLHTRTRRTRNKYSKLYRRRAGAQVSDDRSRARAHAAHHRTLVKAEAFEEALARVSTAVAKAARRTAAELKSERLAAARLEHRGGAARRPSPDGRSTGPGSGPGRRPAKRRTPSDERANASTRAAGRRAQARSDAR